jgi:2,3-bisphosphoglycerate-independent phosphoglycerate mutase
VTDDRIPSAIAQNYRGIRRDDAVFLVNLRPDLGATMMQELLESEIGGMLSAIASLTPLEGAGLDWVEPLFARQPAPETFAKTVSDAGLNQLLLTETMAEKNLSLFWRGGDNRIYENETLALAETPLAKFEKRPELAAADLAVEAMNAIKLGERDLIIINFPNVALHGRGGNMRTTIDAAEAIDKHLGKIAAQVEKRGLTMAITSAFGLGEMMVDPETGKPWHGPTASNLPFTLIAPGLAATRQKSAQGVLRFGSLSDVAPTLLTLLGLAQPEAMTGRSLLIDPDASDPRQSSLERPNSVPA